MVTPNAFVDHALNRNLTPIQILESAIRCYKSRVAEMEALRKIGVYIEDDSEIHRKIDVATSEAKENVRAATQYFQENF